MVRGLSIGFVERGLSIGYPLRLSTGFICRVYPQGCSTGFIHRVVPLRLSTEGCSAALIHRVYLQGLSAGFICRVYPMSCVLGTRAPLGDNRCLYPALNPGPPVLCGNGCRKSLDKCRVSISRNEWGIKLWVGY